MQRRGAKTAWTGRLILTRKPPPAEKVPAFSLIRGTPQELVGSSAKDLSKQSCQKGGRSSSSVVQLKPRPDTCSGFTSLLDRIPPGQSDVIVPFQQEDLAKIVSNLITLGHLQVNVHRHGLHVVWTPV